MSICLASVHDCSRLHTENQNLRKRLQQLKVENSELQQELAGFRERQRIDQILDGHVRKRTSMTQTDACESEASAPNRRRQNADASPTVEKLIAMQQQARQLYEKELKRSVDHVQMITAQNGKILELQKELAKCERAAKQMEADRQRLRKQLAAVSDSRVQQLQLKLQRIKEENANLRCELRGLDSDFFNEIEDLKFGLEQATKLNQRYEKCMQHLCAKYGIPTDAWQLRLKPADAP